MIETPLTRRLGIAHPIILAPMATASGGQLAGAVSDAGGLGLIGGGYCDAEWIDAEFEAAGNRPVGIGFITWALADRLTDDPTFLTRILDRRPKAVFLSFADPAPVAPMVREAGVPLIVQVQTLRDARRAVEVGAEIVVAQGSEAGGHGERRATMTLVPEVADMVARHDIEHGTDTLVVAAGGIADGRGLAAALMLGASGVVMGSRLWASDEALVHPDMIDAGLMATGDETVRSSVMDIARELDWPQRYTARVLENDFTRRWHHDIEGLKADAERQSSRWRRAWVEGDTSVANTFVGEAAGLIRSRESAADILHGTVRDAAALLEGGWRRVGD